MITFNLLEAPGTFVNIGILCQKEYYSSQSEVLKPCHPHQTSLTKREIRSLKQEAIRHPFVYLPSWEKCHPRVQKTVSCWQPELALALRNSQTSLQPEHLVRRKEGPQQLSRNLKLVSEVDEHKVYLLELKTLKITVLMGRKY